MQIISRAHLLATLMGPVFNPEQQFKEEYTAFAALIDERLSESWTHLVLIDSEETGADFDLDKASFEATELIDTRYTADSEYGKSYYGITEYVPLYGSLVEKPVIYSCYLGGSPLNSAFGFYLCAATMLPPA